MHRVRAVAVNVKDRCREGSSQLARRKHLAAQRKRSERAAQAFRGVAQAFRARSASIPDAQRKRSERAA